MLKQGFIIIMTASSYINGAHSGFLTNFYTHLLVGREEALTEYVMGWNKRKIHNLPKYLAIRYAKVRTRGNFVFHQSVHLFTFWPLSQSERVGLFYFRFRHLFYTQIYCRK